MSNNNNSFNDKRWKDRALLPTAVYEFAQSALTRVLSTSYVACGLEENSVLRGQMGPAAMREGYDKESCG